MRLFIAVFFPEEIKSSLYGLVNDLSREAAGVRWVGRENLHLTLRFLGEVGEERLDALTAAASAASLKTAACTGRLSGLGAFPSLERARVFWVGMKEGAAELTGLSLDLEKRLAEAGFENADKPFKPHLTIGRAREPKGLDALVRKIKATEFETESFPVDSFSVVKSTLTASGPIYNRLSTFRLSGQGS